MYPCQFNLETGQEAAWRWSVGRCVAVRGDGGQFVATRCVLVGVRAWWNMADRDSAWGAWGCVAVHGDAWQFVAVPCVTVRGGAWRSVAARGGASRLVLKDVSRPVISTVAASTIYIIGSMPMDVGKTRT